jgi:6-phosphogluconolactonase
MTDQPMFAYVSCAEDKRIKVYALDSQDGDVRALQDIAVPGEDGPSPSNMPLAFSPDGRRLYAAVRSSPYLSTCFDVDPDSGLLTLRSSTPLLHPMAYIAVDASGRCLLCASYKAGKIAVFPIGPDGDVAPLPGTLIDDQPKAHCILSGKRAGTVFATVLERNKIVSWRLDTGAGLLMPGERTDTVARPGSGPRHLTWHPALDVLYAVNETAGSVDAYRCGDAGALQLLQTEALMPDGFAGNARAADIHVTKGGRFLYASVRSAETITGFAVDSATGRLSRLGCWQAGGSPRSFGLSPDGKWMIAALQDLGVADVYRVMDDGMLEKRSRFETGGNPSWVEITRGGAC